MGSHPGQRQVTDLCDCFVRVLRVCVQIVENKHVMGDAIAEVCLHIRTHLGDAPADTLEMAFYMRIERANERESERAREQESEREHLACLICT